jgi:hypothetical protein
VAVHDAYAVAPLTRQTIFVGDVPGMAGVPSFSTTVRSVNGVGVVAERAMYWSSMVEGHTTAGATARSAAWWFGEGRQGTVDGLAHDTFVLVLNEAPQALALRAEYALETGVTIVRTYTAPAGSRYTIWAGDVPELVGQRFSLILTGTAADLTTPKAFVAERMLYWGAGWYGGSGSLGVPRR